MEAAASPEVILTPVHSKRASTEHRFEVMELMTAAAPDDAGAIRTRFQWPVRRAYGTGLVLALLALLAGAVYVSKREPAVGEPSSTSVGDASYATRPIRAGASVDTPQLVKPAPATPPGRQAASNATPCTPAIAALGLCTPAREKSERAASDERTQQPATVQ